MQPQYSSDFPDQELRIADTRLRMIHSYWTMKSARRRIPRRADLNPADLKPVLPFLLMVDVLSPTAYRFRLVGTALVSLHGEDHTGRLVTEAFEPDIARSLQDSYAAVIRDQRPRLWQGTLDWHRGRERIMAAAIHLPLSTDGQAVDRIFGGLVYGPQPVRAADAGR